MALALMGCYSNNCPLENTVLCNYYFYDSEGTPITYGDAITVYTLRPGWKCVYVYRKLGNTTVSRDYIDSALIRDGYTMTETTQRNDTLLNKKSNASSIQLPMSYFNSADTLVFSYGGISLKDTILVKHDSYPHVELPECGSYRFHTLKEVSVSTNAAIDHVEISNRKVNYDGQENVKIYFNGVVTEQ